MDLLHWVRWGMAGLLGVFWLLAAAGNLSDLIRAWRAGAPTSLLLFFGGAAGVLAVLACPLPGANAWAWLPAVLDPGCVPAGVLILYAAMTGRFHDADD